MIIPGHSVIPHARVSFATPVQFFPPNAADVLMFLVRCCSPAPQLTEQLFHSPYAFHRQSTENIKMKLSWVYKTMAFVFLISENLGELLNWNSIEMKLQKIFYLGI